MLYHMMMWDACPSSVASFQSLANRLLCKIFISLTLCSHNVLVVLFQADHHAGPHRLVTAAARATKVKVRARVARPSMSSPPPAPRANQKPVPPRVRSFVGLSADKHTSKPSIGRPRKKGQEVSYCSSSNLSSGVRAISSALLLQAHGTRVAPRNGQPRRRWVWKRSWRSASRTSARSRSRSISRSASTCGRPIFSASTACELQERLPSGKLGRWTTLGRGVQSCEVGWCKNPSLLPQTCVSSVRRLIPLQIDQCAHFWSTEGFC